MKRPVYFRWSDSRRPALQDDRTTAARVIRAHRRSALACVRYERATGRVEVEVIGAGVIGIWSRATA